jgi:deoxyribodipyrimidine photolyase
MPLIRLMPEAPSPSCKAASLRPLPTSGSTSHAGFPQLQATRNGLVGLDYSSKWSLASHGGVVAPASPRCFDNSKPCGATESSYWLWFELLWRDYFRFLHLQHGRALYRARVWARCCHAA